MSTDLKLTPNLPKIPLAVVKIQRSPPRQRSEDGAISSSDEECRTPTSTEHQIPTSLTCPPAPRKPKPCKRKLVSELEFFEVANRHEVEGFFLRAKRRCAW